MRPSYHGYVDGEATLSWDGTNNKIIMKCADAALNKVRWCNKLSDVTVVFYYQKISFLSVILHSNSVSYDW